MDFSIGPQQQHLIERMTALGRTVAALPSRERLPHLAAAGVLGLCIDTRYGGGGHSLLTTALAFEALGTTLSDGGLLLALGAHLFGVAMTLQRVGDEAQKARWLPALASGHTLATVAATERAAGSDIARVTTLIDPCAGGYRVSGEKAYVTRAQDAGLYLLVGRAGGKRGLSVVLLPHGSKIMAGPRWDTLGLRQAGLAPLTVNDVLVKHDALLGKHGAGMAVFQIAMTYERALVLAFRLGAMQRQLHASIAFVTGRRFGQGAQRGPLLGGMQATAGRIAKMHARIEGARLLLYRAAWLLDNGQRAQSAAALAKWQLGEAALANALDAVQLRGGAGFLADNHDAAVMHDALGGNIHSGTPEVLAHIVARWLGLPANDAP